MAVQGCSFTDVYVRPRLESRPPPTAADCWSRVMLVGLGKRVSLVVFLRGVNVGGHRTFRPTTLAEQLKHLDAVNVGAAGTFVIRRPVTRAQLRAELARRLPFDAEIMICPGREIVRLMSRNHFANQPVRPDIVRFVSILSKRPARRRRRP
jgi:hypothetical protein